MPVKRLKQKLLAMEPNTSTYTEMYNGSMSVIDPRYPTMPAVTVYEPTAEDIKAFQDAALGFYSDKDVTANWTPGLYETVKAAMGAN